MRNRILAAALVFATALPVIVQAQPRPDRQRQHMQREKREEVREKMETMMIWKMTDELDLTEEQAAGFFPILKEFREQTEALHEQRKVVTDKLAQLVWETEVEKQQIDQLIEQMDVFEMQSIELRKKFREDAREVLEPKQVGKLVLFNQHFPQVMREMIREHRDRPPDPPGGPGPGDKSW